MLCIVFLAIVYFIQLFHKLFTVTKDLFSHRRTSAYSHQLPILYFFPSDGGYLLMIMLERNRIVICILILFFVTQKKRFTDEKQEYIREEQKYFVF